MKIKKKYKVRKGAIYCEIRMSESVNDRGSLTSDIGEIEIVNDENEFEDQRLGFILNYLSLVYGTTPIVFKKGVESE